QDAVVSRVRSSMERNSNITHQAAWANTNTTMIPNATRVAVWERRQPRSSTGRAGGAGRSSGARLMRRPRANVASVGSRQPTSFQRLHGVVRDDQIGAGAADAGERFAHGGGLVERSGGGRGADHGVLAGDEVRHQR